MLNMNDDSVKRNIFDITDKVVVITGGGGMLGYQHAAAVTAFGAIPVMIDIDLGALNKNSKKLSNEFGVEVMTLQVDITNYDSVLKSKNEILKRHQRIDVLINNAARNPKMELESAVNFSRLENFSMDQWRLDIDVGLGGAFNCSKVYGAYMADSQLGGVIINIASDLGVIAPDQRLYEQFGKKRAEQPVKPVTYSVVKHGLIGLTKYLATYWCEEGVRCNALSPGGVYAGQDATFVSNLEKLIPLGRMAKVDDYRGAIVFLCSDASSYLNGANLVVDGGRSVW